MHFSKALVLIITASFIALTSCQRTGSDVWEDTKSGGRHIGRGFKSFGGKSSDSRAISDRSRFYGADVDETGYTLSQNSAPSDFVPLSDLPESQEIAMAEFVSKQPREMAGDPGSSIPGIESFRDPATMNLANVFQNVHFNYNSYVVEGSDNNRILNQVANWLKAHPNTYAFVEGHCDERGPAAYNLALGARRANAVRDELITLGVSPDNLFTISYGKERPLVLESHDEGWSKNRRAEFKLYSR